MSTFITDHRHNATAIYLINNEDGVHNESELLGYVALDSFVVLCELMTEHYIHKYNKHEVFATYSMGFDNSLSIQDIGDMNSPANIGLPIYSNVATMCNMTGFKTEAARIGITNPDIYPFVLKNDKDMSLEELTEEELELKEAAERAKKEHEEYMECLGAAIRDIPIFAKALKCSKFFTYLDVFKEAIPKHEQIKKIYKYLYREIPEDGDLDTMRVIAYLMDHIIKEEFI